MRIPSPPTRNSLLSCLWRNRPSRRAGGWTWTVLFVTSVGGAAATDFSTLGPCPATVWSRFLNLRVTKCVLTSDGENGILLSSSSLSFLFYLLPSSFLLSILHRLSSVSSSLFHILFVTILICPQRFSFLPFLLYALGYRSLMNGTLPSYLEASVFSVDEWGTVV